MTHQRKRERGKNKRFKKGVRVYVYEHGKRSYKMILCVQGARKVRWYIEKNDALLHIELTDGTLVERTAKSLYKWGVLPP